MEPRGPESIRSSGIRTRANVDEAQQHELSWSVLFNLLIHQS